MRRLYTLYLFPVLALLLVGVLACGPADESVQRGIGNLPDEAPTQSPLEAAQPPEAPRRVAQDETSTSDPTPIPTVCYPWPTEWEGANESGVMCVHTPPQVPPRYPKLMGELGGAAVEAEEEGGDAGGASGASDDKLFYVEIWPTSQDGLEVITSWLDERGISHTVHREAGYGPTITTALTGAQAGPLSELPAVGGIDDISIPAQDYDPISIPAQE